MNIQIENFLGIERADIESARVLLLTGSNGRGKTSIINAVRMVTSSKKPNSKVMNLISHNHNGSFSVAFNDNEMKFNGKVQKRLVSEISEIASGKQKFMDFKAKDRIKYLIDTVGVELVDDDLVSALAEAGTVNGEEKRILTDVKAFGWEQAQSMIHDQVTESKGEWRGVTGEVWGIKKASNWRPEGLTETVKTAEELKVLADETTGEYIRGLQVSTMLSEGYSSNAELGESLKRNSGMKEEIKKEIAEIRETIKVNEKVLRGYISVGEKLACPYCKKPLVVRDYKIMKPEDADVADGDKYAGAEKSLKTDQKSLEKKTGLLHEISILIEKEEAHLRFLDAKQIELETVSTDLDVLKDKSEALKEQHRLAEKFAKASSLNANIVRLIEIESVLSPDGYQKRMISKMLNEIDDSLNALTVRARWKAISINSEGSVIYDSIPYEFLSRSEQMRVNILFQVALSKWESEHVIIIDDADTLDKSGRNGLFRIIKKAEQEFIVGMMIDSKDDVPKLPDELGASHWIENRTAERI